MRVLKTIVAVMMAAAVFTSCKKEKVKAPEFAGVWQGKWGNGPQDPASFIKFEFKSNGELTRLDEQGQVFATGNWTLNGVQFDCTYTHNDGQVHKITGLYTDFDGFINGTWGFSPSKTNGGKVELTKQ